MRVVGAMWGKVRAPSLDPASTPASATDNPLTAPGWRRERSSAGPPLAGTRTQVHCQKGVQTQWSVQFETRSRCREGIGGGRGGQVARGHACQLAVLPPKATPAPRPNSPSLAVNDVSPSLYKPNGVVARKPRRTRPRRASPGRLKVGTSPASMHACWCLRTAQRGLRHPFCSAGHCTAQWRQARRCGVCPGGSSWS